MTRRSFPEVWAVLFLCRVCVDGVLDTSSVLPSNSRPLGGPVITLLGNDYSDSPGVAVGQTACRSTAWLSTSAIQCAIAAGISESLGATVTAAGVLVTSQSAVSHDSARLLLGMCGNAVTHGDNTITFTGQSLGAVKYSGSVRLRHSQSTSTIWKSDTSVLCKTTSGAARSIAVSATVGHGIGTLSETTTFDSMVVAALTQPNVCIVSSSAVCIAGANLGAVLVGLVSWAATPQVRAAGSACERTVWFSDSVVSCATATGGGRHGGLTLSLAAAAGSASASISHDLLSHSATNPANGLRGLADLTITASNFVLLQSPSGRVAPTACEHSVWVSLTAISCNRGQGREGSASAVVSVGAVAGSLTHAFTFDSLALVSTAATCSSGVCAVVAGAASLLRAQAASVSARAGATACPSSQWHSDTSIVCAVANSALASGAVRASVGAQVGSATEMLSFDAAALVAATINLPWAALAVTSSLLSISTSAAVAAERWTVSARIGGSACLSTAWTSSSSVMAQAVLGRGASQHVAVTHGARVGSASAMTSFDHQMQPRAVSQDRSSAGNSTLDYVVSLSLHAINGSQVLQASIASRVGGSAALGSWWQSTTSATCRAARVSSASNYLVVSAGTRALTLTEALSFELAFSPWLVNQPGSSGIWHHLAAAPSQTFWTAAARVGGSACSSARWSSSTTLTLRSPPAWTGGAKPTVVSSSGLAGSVCSALTIDSPAVSAWRGASGWRNVQLGSASNLTIAGQGLGAGDALSPLVRMGPTRTAASHWMSETSLLAMSAAGTGATLPLRVIFDGEGGGTLSEAVSYHRPQVSSKSTMNLAPSHSSSVALSVSGSAFGIWSSSLANREKGTSGQSTRWLSSTSLACQVSSGTSQSWVSMPATLTADQQPSSVSVSVTFDSPQISTPSAQNICLEGGDRLTLAGRGLGGWSLSPRALIGWRLNATAGPTHCAATAWSADSSVLCAAAPGSLSELSIVLSQARAVGSVSKALTYNAAEIRGCAPCNIPFRGSTPLRLLGAGLRSWDATLGVRVGGSACEQSRWEADSSVRCSAASAGRSWNSSQPAVVSVGGVVATLELPVRLDALNLRETAALSVVEARLELAGMAWAELGAAQYHVLERAVRRVLLDQGLDSLQDVVVWSLVSKRRSLGHAGSPDAGSSQRPRADSGTRTAVVTVLLTIPPSRRLELMNTVYAESTAAQLLAELQEGGLQVTTVTVAQGKVGYFDSSGSLVGCCCDPALCACYACAPELGEPAGSFFTWPQVASFAAAALAALICVAASKRGWQHRNPAVAAPEEEEDAQRATEGDGEGSATPPKYSAQPVRSSIAARPLSNQPQLRSIDEVLAIRRKARLAWGDFDDF